jgi:hypothetical protein
MNVEPNSVIQLDHENDCQRLTMNSGCREIIREARWAPLRRSGIEPAEGSFDHRPCKVGKSKRARPRRVNEQLSIVRLLTLDIVGDIRVAENGVIPS